jgi:amino acid transporter
MSQVSNADEVTERPRHEIHVLKAGSLGLIGILLLAFSSAAPLVGSLGNIPLAISIGNGIGAPAGFIIVTLVLLCFAVGYVAMARKLTAVGGFYSFISHGLGRPLGLAAGWSALLAYICVELALFGALGYFGRNAFLQFTGIDISWVWIALAGLVIITALTYFGIELSARVLGVLFLCEISILAVVDAAVFIKGGASGVTTAPLSPSAAFGGAAAGIGIFFAFWSWLGFEVVPNYAEESKNPARLVGLATYAAVIGLGVIYTITSWAGVLAFGTGKAVDAATKLSGSYYIEIASRYVGTFAHDAMSWLVLTSSFACALAFHQTVSRYLYAMGRENVVLPVHLGRTHLRYGSPHVATMTQGAIATLVLVVYIAFYHLSPSVQQFSAQFDPKNPFEISAYVVVFSWLAITTTFWIMMNQFICSFAVIRYFREPENRAGFHPWKTLIAPLIGAAGIGYALLLLFTNLITLGGDVIWVRIIPWFCAGWFILGLGLAYWVKWRKPDTYEQLGRVITTGAITNAS